MLMFQSLIGLSTIANESGAHASVQANPSSGLQVLLLHFERPPVVAVVVESGLEPDAEKVQETPAFGPEVSPSLRWPFLAAP